MKDWMGRVGRSAAAGVLAPFGMRLMRSSNDIIDLRQSGADPVEAQYRARLRPFLIDVPVQDLRVLPSMAFVCGRGVGNPFVDALANGAGGDVEFSGSVLGRYYECWQPTTAAQVLGVAAGTNATLDAAPALSFVMPWSGWGLEEAAQRWRGFILADNREHGAQSPVVAGWKGWGPVSADVGNQELRRLEAVHRSIQTKGFQRSDAADGDIKGVVLLADNAFRVLVTAGHHRSAALAALGHQTASVRIDNPLVRRSDAPLWPNVRSRLFTEEQALEIFDRQFAGRQPPAYQATSGA